MGNKTGKVQTAIASHRRRGARTVYKPVANAVVVAMYESHMSFFVNDL